MPALQINIEGSFEKLDLHGIAPFTPETIIATALLSPLDIREQDIITLLTSADCQRKDAVQIMREVKLLLGKHANGRNIRTYEVVEELGQVFLDNQRTNLRRSLRNVRRLTGSFANFHQRIFVRNVLTSC